MNCSLHPRWQQPKLQEDTLPRADKAHHQADPVGQEVM